MRRTESFEKTLTLGKIEAGRRRVNREWDGWITSPTQWTWVWVNSGVGGGQGGLVCCGSWGHKESDTIERLNWIYPSIGWWTFRHFYLLVIMNNAAVNIQGFVWMYVFIYPESIPGVESLSHMVTLWCLSEELAECFPKWLPHFTIPSTKWESSSFSTSLSTLIVCLFGYSHRSECRLASQCGVIGVQHLLRFDFPWGQSFGIISLYLARCLAHDKFSCTTWVRWRGWFSRSDVPSRALSHLIRLSNKTSLSIRDRLLPSTHHPNLWFYISAHGWPLLTWHPSERTLLRKESTSNVQNAPQIPSHVAHVSSSSPVPDAQVLLRKPSASVSWPCVWVSHGHCYKRPQTWWLETTQLITLVLCGPGATYRSHWAKIKVSAGSIHFGGSRGERIHFLAFFYLLEDTPVPWLITPSSIFQTTLTRLQTLLR